jgi:hypothetical protein
MKPHLTRYFAIFLVLALVTAAPATVAQNYTRPAQEVGGEVVSNPSSSTALTVPANAQWAMFSIRTAGAHFSFDGTAATTSDLYMAAGSVFLVDDNALLAGIRVINSSDGAAVIYVKYFRKR